MWRSRCHELSDDEKFEQLMEAFTAVGRGGPMRELVKQFIDEGKLDELCELVSGGLKLQHFARGSAKRRDLFLCL